VSTRGPRRQARVRGHRVHLARRGGARHQRPRRSGPVAAQVTAEGEATPPVSATTAGATPRFSRRWWTRGHRPSPHHARPAPDLGSQAIAAGLPAISLPPGTGATNPHPHPAFRDAWARWWRCVRRRATGCSCDVWEVYDQFSGGDKTPWAIPAFPGQAFPDLEPGPELRPARRGRERGLPIHDHRVRS